MDEGYLRTAYAFWVRALGHPKRLSLATSLQQFVWQARRSFTCLRNGHARLAYLSFCIQCMLCAESINLCLFSHQTSGASHLLPE